MPKEGVKYNNRCHVEKTGVVCNGQEGSKSLGFQIDL